MIETPGATARQLAVGHDTVNNKIVLRIASNRGALEVALSPQQALDMVRQIEHLAMKMGLTDGKVILPP